MPGCGTAGCTCADCGCAAGACNCGKCKFSRRSTSTYPPPYQSMLITLCVEINNQCTSPMTVNNVGIDN
ncbi:hypothetical protein BU24DRAFT_416306 [Aaosphaeria arxii CBS 175.79]|uniref:Metallothionein n=1 Tax=Aaosphaeria arxii CBS 175.79 TaxID=1450172 RepID=A0A6A5Y7A8_9PLEO|nr:uncharacterized protein BU24DRAFT_416306 [Aaosphaeria arxii CBS 175.79]KAF2020631.1 hypothetical protein BU24DRAFT_416306 [Aaosphaeria arxii CBS 175.79]